jgi:1-acyl-sn-glycerol-3-phosphate acyltransferase
MLQSADASLSSRGAHQTGDELNREAVRRSVADDFAVNPLLIPGRLARMGGHVLESVGRFRMQTRGLEPAARYRLRAERLRQVSADVCRVHGFDMRVRGTLPAGPVVLVANHLSYIDALVLTGLTPCTPIAKGEVRGWPVVGAGADALGVVFVKRGDAYSGARALREGLRLLRAGVSVLGFPEGTTSDGADVLPFRRGLFGIARIANVPVVPMCLRYPSQELCWVGDQWFVPHYLRTAMRSRSLAEIYIGEPVDPHSVGSVDELTQRVRSQIRSLIRRRRS